eukprot:gene8769-717_t
MSKIFAFFITDHGFGHASRSCSILKELVKEENVRITIVTSIPQTFIEEKFEEKYLEKLDFLHYKVDVGVYQTSSVEIDIKKTLSELENFWNSMKEKIEKICCDLKERNCEKIIFDVTPIACEVGNILGLKSVGISNFTWDWIYHDYIEDEKTFEKFIKLNLEFYQKADYFIKLPYFVSKETFKPEKTKLFQVDWFAESPKKSKKEILNLLLNDKFYSKKVLFFSFGGHSNVDIIKKLSNFENVPDDWILTFVLMNKTQMNKIDKKIIENEKIIILNEHELTNQFGIQYIDLFSLADVIAGKTGYTTVSEVIVNNLNFLYTERGKFREQDVLMKALEENSNSTKIEIEDIYNLTTNLFLKSNKLLKNQKRESKTSYQGDKEISKILLNEI